MQSFKGIVVPVGFFVACLSITWKETSQGYVIKKAHGSRLESKTKPSWVLIMGEELEDEGTQGANTTAHSSFIILRLEDDEGNNPWGNLLFSSMNSFVIPTQTQSWGFFSSFFLNPFFYPHSELKKTVVLGTYYL